MVKMWKKNQIVSRYIRAVDLRNVKCIFGENIDVERFT